MRWPFMTTCRVPRDLAAVTTIRTDAEVNPRDVGVSRAGVAAIWQAVERLYQSGIHPAIQLCVRRGGEVLIDRAIGHTSGNGPDDPPDAKKVLVTPDTPFNIYSASKAISAMLIHLLDQRGQLHLDDVVCEYIPEFGVHGKEWITIRHVLTHRAGIPNLPPEMMRLENLEHDERILRLLCDAQPTSRAGRQLAYHAITGGFVLAEVVRRVTGKNIRTLLETEIRDPLGMRWMSFGARPRDIKHVAVNYFTGPPPLPPMSTVLNRALGVEFRQVVDLTNDPRLLRAIVPSGNGVTNANELSTFYQLLLNGGELNGVRIFEPRTVRRATSEQSYLEIDFMLAFPLRYGMGFMLGAERMSPYGPDTPHAYGHIGFTNIISWADPERQVAAALLTSGKPLLYPQVYHLFDILRQIGQACPKVRAQSAAPVVSRIKRPAAKPRAARRARATA